METIAFQKIHTRVDQITKATISLHARGIGNEEMAMVNDRLAQVVKIQGDLVTLQVFQEQKEFLPMPKSYSWDMPHDWELATN